MRKRDVEEVELTSALDPRSVLRNVLLAHLNYYDRLEQIITITWLIAHWHCTVQGSSTKRGR
jgi:hypothetical protein